MQARRFLTHCLALAGLGQGCCTFPFIDLHYRDSLSTQSTFLFKGRLMVMGNFRKTVSMTYDPQIFGGPSDWKSEVHSIPSEYVYSVSEPDAILETQLYARPEYVISTETLKEEGRLNTPLVIRDSQYYIEQAGRMFVVGGRFRSNVSWPEDRVVGHYDDVWSSGDGYNWQRVAQDPPWAKIEDIRDHHRIAGFNGHIYLARAVHAGGKRTVVWRSADGTAWKQMGQIADLDRVDELFSFKGRLFLLGTVAGKEGQSLFHSDNGNDWLVSDSLPRWRYSRILACHGKLYGFSAANLLVSDDGIHWTHLVQSPNIPHKVATYNDRMAALELFDRVPAHSVDGIHWFNESKNLQFSFDAADLQSGTIYENEYQIVSLNGFLWVIGESADRIYRSRDGRSWEKLKVESGKSFIPRSGAAVTVYQNKLWVLGGRWRGHLPGDTQGPPRSAYILLHDAWYSSDGKSWYQSTPKAPWQSRMNAVARDFNGKLTLVGGSGYGEGDRNLEIWQSTDGVAWNRTFKGGSDMVAQAEIRNDFVEPVVQSGMLHIFDRFMGRKWASSTDARTFSITAFKGDIPSGRVVNVTVGAKQGYLSQSNRDFRFSWDLAEWYRLDFSAQDSRDYYRMMLCSLHGQPYLVDVNPSADAPVHSVPLLIDPTSRTIKEGEP